MQSLSGDADGWRACWRKQRLWSLPIGRRGGWLLHRPRPEPAAGDATLKGAFIRIVWIVLGEILIIVAAPVLLFILFWIFCAFANCSFG